MSIEEKKIEDIIKGDIIFFKYKGQRNTGGEVLWVDSKQISVRICIPYKGKNVEWEAGESKVFNIKEIKSKSLRVRPKDYYKTGEV